MQGRRKDGSSGNAALGSWQKNLSPFVSHQVLWYDIYIPTWGSVTLMTRLHFNMLLWKHNQSQFSSLDSQEDEEERESCHSWYPGDHWWSEMKQSTVQKDHLEKGKNYVVPVIICSWVRSSGFWVPFWSIGARETSREIQNPASFSSPVEPHHRLTKWNVSWCFLCQSVNVKTSLFFIRTVQEFC